MFLTPVFFLVNQGDAEAGNYVISAEVSADGLSLICTMNESKTVFYPTSEFNINHGYLDIKPMTAKQVDTSLTLTLDKAIRKDTVVTLDKLSNSENFGQVYGVPASNNSMVAAPEFVSASVSGTGDIITAIMDESLASHIWSAGDFVFKVNGEERGIWLDPYCSGGVNIILAIEGTVLSGETTTLSFTPMVDPQIEEFTDSSVFNGSTLTDSESLPPAYLMTAAPTLENGFYRLPNSAVGAVANKARLRKPDGSAMTLLEVTARYLQDSSLDLSGSYDADTEWVAPVDAQWNHSFVYNLNMGISCDFCVMDYFEHDPEGDPGVFTLDIYLAHRNINASLNVDLPLLPSYAAVPYTPSLESVKLEEEAPGVIYPDAIIYKMDEIIEDLKEVYISFGTHMTDLPSGVSHINSFTSGAVPDSPVLLLDKDGVDTGMTLTWDVAFEVTLSDYGISGDDSGFLYDAQQIRGFFYNCYDEASVPHIFRIGNVDSTKTHTVKVSGSSPSIGTKTKYIINANVTEVVMTNNIDLGATETDMTGGTEFDIVVDRTTENALMFVMGMSIIQTG